MFAPDRCAPGRDASSLRPAEVTSDSRSATMVGDMLDFPAPAILALDLGGSQVRAAVIESDGTVRVARRTRTPVEAGGEAIVEACITALRAAREAYGSPRPADTGAEGSSVDPVVTGSAGPTRIVAIGISAPGPVDPHDGVILDAPNLGPGFQGRPLAARVEAALGLPTVLDRDTQVAALAELAWGAAVGCRDFLYLTVSTGIGGAVVADGRLLRGPDGTAGELGHLLVDRYGPVCGCGAIGHLEGIASGSGMARAAREAAASGESPHLATLITARGAAFGALEVVRAAAAGDPVAEAILAGGREAFALACVSLVDIFDPERIVVGGSVAIGQGDAWLEPAREAVRSTAFRRPAARVRIVPAALGDDVGLIGALVLVRERLPGLMGP